MIFLPPNLTSEIQPLDQGIIKAAKSHYRKNMMQFLLYLAETSNCPAQFFKSITVLYAIRWIYAAWENVSPLTIQKCFSRCGFSLLELPAERGCDSPFSEEIDNLIQSLPESVRSDLLDNNEIDAFEN